MTWFLILRRHTTFVLSTHSNCTKVSLKVLTPFYQQISWWWKDCIGNWSRRLGLLQTTADVLSFLTWNVRLNMAASISRKMTKLWWTLVFCCVVSGNFIVVRSKLKRAFNQCFIFRCLFAASSRGLLPACL